MTDEEWLLLPAALARHGRADAQAYLLSEIHDRLRRWLRIGILEGLRLEGLPAPEVWARLFGNEPTFALCEGQTERPIPTLQPWVELPQIDWESSMIQGPAHWRAIRIEVAASVADRQSASVVPSSYAEPVSKKGGRPTDKELVIDEAGRRFKAGPRIPSTLVGFAKELEGWLNQQPGAYRNAKTGLTMRAATIEDHIRSLWAQHRAD